MKQFQTVNAAAEYVWHRYENGYNYELLINDTLCFSALGIYAFVSETRKAGIKAEKENNSAFTRNLTRKEVNTLLTWLLENDGYLIAA